MHRSALKWISAAAVAALLAGVPMISISPARAQDAAATSQPAGKATITVTVTDSDQKPVAKARVRLMPGKPAEDGSRPQPIATGRTDEDGKATLSGIADGDYVVAASSKTAGAGREKVTVSNGADATVSITVKERKKKGGDNGNAAPSTQPTN